MSNFGFPIPRHDPNNSTTTPLGAGATFLGVGTDLLADDTYLQVHFTFKFRPNVVPDGDASTAQGSLFFEFSPDNSNWDISFPIFARDGINIPQTLIFVDRYFRVRYVNDGGAAAIAALNLSETPSTPVVQTEFRFNTYLLPFGTKELGRTLDQRITGSDPISLTRSVVSGLDGDSAFQNARVNKGGAFSVTRFEVEVANGNVTGHSNLEVFGRNPTVGTGSAPEDITNIGGTYTGQPDGFTPETVDVVSTDANDTSAGTGARTVRLTGLLTDASTVFTTEDIVMNGLTPVVSSNTWYRIFRAEVLTYGSGATNAGTITVTATTTTSVVFAQIDPGFGMSENGVFTVPAGKTGYILSIFNNLVRSGGSAGSSEITVRKRDTGQGGYNAIRSYYLQTGGPSKPNIVFPIECQSGCDVKMMVEDVSDNGSQFTTELDVLLVDN